MKTKSLIFTVILSGVCINVHANPFAKKNPPEPQVVESPQKPTAPSAAATKQETSPKVEPSQKPTTPQAATTNKDPTQKGESAQKPATLPAAAIKQGPQPKAAQSPVTKKTDRPSKPLKQRSVEAPRGAETADMTAERKSAETALRDLLGNE